jgi:hypothetical protein
VLQLRWRVRLVGVFRNDRKDEAGPIQMSAVDKTRAVDTCIPKVPTISLEKGRLVNWQVMMTCQSGDASACARVKGDVGADRRSTVGNRRCTSMTSLRTLMRTFERIGIHAF